MRTRLEYSFSLLYRELFYRQFDSLSFEVTLREKITKWRSLLSGLTVSCSILSMLKFLIPNNNVELTNHFSRSILQYYSHKKKPHLTLIMTSAKVVETSVTPTDSSLFQDEFHLDDQTTWSTVALVRTSNHCILNTFYLFSNSGKTSGVCFQSSRWPGLTPSHSDSNGSSSKS